MRQEKSTIFRTDMVQAALNERKTQFRQVMMPQPTLKHTSPPFWYYKDCQWIDGGIGFPESGIVDYAPYQIGDIIWVKEAWRMYEKAVGAGENFRVKQFFAYKANENNPKVSKSCEWHDNLKQLGLGLYETLRTGSWCSPSHMPREAARLFLQVKSVRVEQLRDITDENAKAEGVNVGVSGFEKLQNSAIDRFNSIFIKQSKGRGPNTWVWVIEFELKRGIS